MADRSRGNFFRASEASNDNWKVAEGIPDYRSRQRYVDDLRETEWVVFTPREIDFQRFRELAERDPYIASETDPRILAEILVLKYPDLFLTVEHVYSIVTDWGIRRCLKRPSFGSASDDPPQVPPHLIDAFSENELTILAKGFFRKWIRRLNDDSKGTIALIEKMKRSSKHQKERLLFECVLAIIARLGKMCFPKFNTEIVPGKPFPSWHVLLWISQLLERDNAIIIGDVGTQKTSAAVIGLEELRSRATVVICRSYAREAVWANEVARYYREPPSPIIFKGNGDLEELEKMNPNKLRRARFLIIGYGGIQSSNQDDDAAEDGDRLVEAVTRLRPDSVIIDEVHAIKGFGKRSSRTLRIARAESVKHCLMLTATPYENTANEAANIATILDRKTFPNQEAFAAQCRGNPRLYFGLMSSRTLDYFSQEDVLDLPPSNYSTLDFFPTVELDCPPDIAMVHRLIADDGKLEARRQVQLMTRFLAIPFVGKDWYPQVGDLDCFSDPLANPKLAYLRIRAAELIKTGKIVIASGIYAEGITRELSGQQPDADIYEVTALFESWFPGKVLRFDVNLANGNGCQYRQMIAEQWRTDPQKRILVVSVQAAAESLNLTVQRAATIDRVTIFWLSLPWKATMYCQFNGRFRRPGTEVPVDSFALIIKGTADEALLQMNEAKWSNFLIGVHGMPLLAVEEKALENVTFEKLIVSPKSWLRQAFGRMTGAGEDKIAGFLKGTLRGLPIGQTIADYYLQTEEYSTTGHIARYAVPILRDWRERGLISSWEKVHDAGCGTLPYERRLKESIYGTDMNPAMIATGRDHSYHRGKNAIERRLSSLPKDWESKFELNLAALVLHLTSSRKKAGNEPERASILRELNRTLLPKGLLWILLPDFCLDEESFGLFVSALYDFGFEVVATKTGHVKARDHREHPFAFWSICLRKSGAPSDDPECPLFLFERNREGVAVRPSGGHAPVSGSVIMVKHEQFVLTPLHPSASSSGPVNRGERFKRLAEAFIARFKIKDDLVAQVVQKGIVAVKPGKWREFKSVWKRLGEKYDVPQINWNKLHSFWINYAH
jgi:SAM-dependent methyltransferase